MSSVGGLLFIFGPVAAFLFCGLASADNPETKWSRFLATATAGTAAWLLYAAAVPHEYDSNLTAFGTKAVLGDGDETFWFVVIAFAVVAGISGWFQVARPIAIGAAIIAGPTLLAWPTMPRGDGDGLWALVFLYLPFFGLMAAGIARFTGAAARRALDADS